MSRFADVLQQASERLQVPEPSRTRILLEMASDLEDSFRVLTQSEGCTTKSRLSAVPKRRLVPRRRHSSTLSRIHRVRRWRSRRSGLEPGGQVVGKDPAGGVTRL